MIVCHCNSITASDIEEAVHCLRSANCSNIELCPRTVYKELAVCPQCCGCFPLAEKMIKEAEITFISRETLTNGTATESDQLSAARLAAPGNNNKSTV